MCKRPCEDNDGRHSRPKIAVQSGVIRTANARRHVANGCRILGFGGSVLDLAIRSPFQNRSDIKPFGYLKSSEASGAVWG